MCKRFFKGMLSRQGSSRGVFRANTLWHFLGDKQSSLWRNSPSIHLTVPVCTASHSRSQAAGSALDHPGNDRLSHRLIGSTMGAERLYFCVRNENRCDTLAIVTGMMQHASRRTIEAIASSSRNVVVTCAWALIERMHRFIPGVIVRNLFPALHVSIFVTETASCGNRSQATRPISTGPLHMLPCFHFPPIKQVVFLWP